jgi:hypothetical protein
MNSCAAKQVSFISLAAIILFLRYLDETRKSPLFGSEEIPAGNGNEKTQIAEFIGKSSLDMGKLPPFRDKEGVQMTKCIGKSNRELRKFLPLGSGRIPVRNGIKRKRMPEFVGKSSLDPGEFTASESKEIQMAESIGKSSLRSGKFLPFGSKEIPADNGNDSTQPGCTRKVKCGAEEILGSWKRENSCQKREHQVTR